MVEAGSQWLRPSMESSYGRAVPLSGSSDTPCQLSHGCTSEEAVPQGLAVLPEVGRGLGFEPSSF